MYRLISIDLDGTLLNSYGLVADYSVEVINQIMQKYPHTHFVINTGRLLHAAIDFYDTYFKNSNIPKRFLISNNGAFIYDNNQEKIIKQTVIPATMLQKMIDFAQEQKIKVRFFGTRSVFANQFGHNSFVWAKIMGASYLVYLSAQDINEPVGYGSFILPETLKKPAFLEFVRLLKKTFPGLHLNPFLNMIVDFAMPAVNKGSALVYLCNYLNINVYDTIAYGDSFNDLEMINLAGVGKVTANADNKLKQVADEVVLANDDNGPACDLAKIFLGEQ